MICEKLASLNLPPLLKFADGTDVTPEGWQNRRAELVDTLSRHQFGFMPEKVEAHGKILTHFDKALGGKAVEDNVEITLNLSGGEFKFPLKVIAPKKSEPKKSEPSPAFVFISFDDGSLTNLTPVEEIIDGGFALAMIPYNSVTRDVDDGYSTGIAPLLGERNATAAGKIAMWAYAASRALDYLLTRDDIDGENVAVIGHSRLGKTALFAGATDERFKYVISNDSGCAGAALARESTLHADAEQLARISSVFPYWFSGDYADYAGRESAMPYDSHWLLAAIAPRYLYIASASEDKWACPPAEFFAAAAASPAWELLGKTGLVAPDRLPLTGEILQSGSIAYHLRSGFHHLSRFDWCAYMTFIKRVMGK